MSSSSQRGISVSQRVGAVWTGLKNAWSPDHRQKFYEDAVEVTIQSAYEQVDTSAKRDEGVAGAVDDIFEFMEDPRNGVWSEANWARHTTLTRQLNQAVRAWGERDKEYIAERCKHKIKAVYGIKERSDDFIRTDTKGEMEVMTRVMEISKQKRQVAGQRIGLMEFILSYESRIAVNRFFIEAVEQAEAEGLLHSSKLISQGVSHASIKKKVEMFDKAQYTEWEADLKPRQAEGTERARRIAYRDFLRKRSTRWVSEYEEWASRAWR